jgi:hypothetical protein
MSGGRKFETEWTKDEIEILIRLWDEGVPSTQIAERIGRTKSSILGKRRRLKLPDREGIVQKNQRLKAARDAKRKPKPKADPNVLAFKPHRNERGTRLRSLPSRTNKPSNFSTCQFIAGTPTIEEDCKCGEPTVKGFSYCEEHLARCYIGTTPGNDRFEVDPDKVSAGPKLNDRFFV